MSEEIKVGSIVVCHLAGYWRVEVVYYNADTLRLTSYQLRPVMTSSFKPIKNSKKRTEVTPREVRLLTEANMAVLRRSIEYGLKKLEELVKGASNG